ncbi:Kunitz-type trypsin inhibitor [Rhynchospora pubera]|uniref:Kunitz-type trypsin inhibitor n=1 Tax=Rhynchospora pubera TaxID=906938 RepID=A0AAV8CX75_9POAL|nr:Kunitz-type trypsin inhibitor [Rhynchospora pubera]
MKFHLLSISLLVIPQFFSLASNAAASDLVYDTDGHPLHPGKQYYILPVIRGHGGGLTMMPHHNHLCPLYVAQENMEVKRGLPLIFRPANSKDKVVHLSSDLNIEFAAVTTCVMTTAWRLGDVEAPTSKRYVITGGFIGNPGQETVSNWFKIEKLGNKEYKLVFCPSVCKTCKVLCGDVEVLNEGGKRLLGLGDESFPVMFKKKD